MNWIIIRNVLNKTRVAQLFSHKVPRIFIILTQDVIILAFLNHPLRHIIRRASTTENIHSSKYKIPPSRCSIHIEQVSLEERREKEKRKWGKFLLRFSHTFTHRLTVSKYKYSFFRTFSILILILLFLDLSLSKLVSHESSISIHCTFQACFSHNKPSRWGSLERWACTRACTSARIFAVHRCIHACRRIYNASAAM